MHAREAGQQLWETMRPLSFSEAVPGCVNTNTRTRISFCDILPSGVRCGVGYNIWLSRMQMAVVHHPWGCARGQPGAPWHVSLLDEAQLIAEVEVASVRVGACILASCSIARMRAVDLCTRPRNRHQSTVPHGH